MPARQRRAQRAASLGAVLLLLAGCTTPLLPPGPGTGRSSSAPAYYDQVPRCDAPSPGAPSAQAAAAVVEESSSLGKGWAGMPVGQALLTTGSNQYVAYYDVKRQLILAQRSIAKNGEPASEWRTKPLDTTLGWDSHNYVTMAVDRDGALHVAGNMHRDPLFYVRTDPGGDITTAKRVTTMVDPAREGSVTYPVFLHLADRSLAFYYRDGGSGGGSIYLNRYREKSGTWDDVIGGSLFGVQHEDPTADEDSNAYITDPVLGDDGYFHVLWVWRTTPDVSSNTDLTYARTKDFTTWYSADGHELPIPFEPGQGDVIDPVPVGGGLINGIQRIGFDHEGKVVVTYAKYDEGKNVQIYAATPDGGTWSTHQLTQWENSFPIEGTGTISPPVSVGRAVPQGSGNLAIDYSCGGAGMTLTVDGDGRFVSQTHRAPEYTTEVLTAREKFEGMRVRVAGDLGPGQGHEPRRRYVLRWEALGSNRDQPRTQWPKQGSEVSILMLEDP